METGPRRPRLGANYLAENMFDLARPAAWKFRGGRWRWGRKKLGRRVLVGERQDPKSW